MAPFPVPVLWPRARGGVISGKLFPSTFLVERNRPGPDGTILVSHSLKGFLFFFLIHPRPLLNFQENHKLYVVMCIQASLLPPFVY
jgi:hypothetical protein